MLVNVSYNVSLAFVLPSIGKQVYRFTSLPLCGDGNATWCVRCKHTLQQTRLLKVRFEGLHASNRMF